MAQPLEMYPVKETTEAVNILREIKSRFASNHVVRDEFFALFTDLAKGVTADGRAVVARANELLQGHPKLCARFHGFLFPDHQIEHPNDVATKPRPLRRRDNRHPTAGAERANPRAGIDAAKREDEEIYDGSLDEAKAKQFWSGSRTKDMEMYDGLLAELLYVDEEQGLDAHKVYRRFKRFFGSAHGDLLGDFAEFLPSKYDPPPRCASAEREEQRPRPKRKHGVSYAAGVDAAERSRAVGAKKPRVDDGPTPKGNAVSYAHEGAAGNSRPSRAKTPCVDDGKSTHASIGGAVKASGPGAAEQDKEEVKRFREAWKFETGYSKLMATMTRAEELQKELPHGASGSHGRRRASLEELFPSHECREYLAQMYHEAWEHMRKLLEDGDQIGSALGIILDRLRMREAAAVEEARNRRDPTRAAQKLYDLVQDRVRVERERRGAQGQGELETELRRSP